MAKKFYLIALVAITSSVYSATCPEGAYIVDYTSEYSGVRKTICMKTINGKDVKHGSEIHYSKTGEQIFNQSYYQGKLVKDKVTSPTPTPQTPIDEAQRFINDFISNALISKSTMEVKADQFSTKGCKGRTQDWINLFMYNRSFTHSYKFGSSCDIQGSWRPAIGKKFPANFLIRKVSNFNRVNMQFAVNYKTKMPPFIVLTVTDGVLISPKGNINFSANYEFEVDLINSIQSKTIKANKHGGKIHFNKVFGKTVSIEKEIKVFFSKIDDLKSH